MRLHLVDGTYELFRAHYAPRPGHTGPTGQDLKATTGVVASLLSLLHDPVEDVTHIAVAFDNPIRSFRNDLYPYYKSDEGMEPALRAQFDTVEAAVRAIGVVVWSMREHEADDGMASGARRFRDQVEQVRIMTPDKDLGQCIVGTRVVQVDRRQMKVTDEAAFRARRGFGPLSMPDFLALTGDSADGFPGLPGFGEKGAGMLVGAYEHIEAIPVHAAEWTVKPRGAAQLAATLAERREEALLYRKLATLVETAPVSESLEELRFRGVPRDRFAAWCAEVGSTQLPTMPRRWEDLGRSSALNRWFGLPLEPSSGVLSSLTGRSSDILRGGLMPRSVTAFQPLRSREPSVLIVDDEAAAGQALGAWFREAGWSVALAGSCREAENEVDAGRPDLLVVEEKLDDGCGLELFLKLRGRHAGLSGVVLTRHGSITGAVRAIHIGFRDYLVKPLERRRLAELFGPPANDATFVRPSLERVEWEHIQAVLSVCRGNISEAARRLGIHRRSLQRRLRRTSTSGP